MIYIRTKQWSAYLWPEHWKEISYNGESVTQHSVNYAGCSSSQTGVNVERRWSAVVSTLASGWWLSLVDTVSYCSAEVWLGPRTTTEAALGTSGWPGCRISNASPYLGFPFHPGRRLPHLWVLLSHAWWSQSSTPEFRSWDSTCCLQRALASPGWVSLADWHPLPSTFLATGSWTPATGSTQHALNLTCIPILFSWFSWRHFSAAYFFYLQRSLGSLDHPDRTLLHPSFLALQDFPCHS